MKSRKFGNINLASSPIVPDPIQHSSVFLEISKYISDRRLTDALGFFEVRGCDPHTALFFIANIQNLMGGAK